MSRDLKTFCLRLAALGAAACSSAYAIHSGAEGSPPLAIAPPIAQSPYEVELVGADGRELATYQNGGRFYVLGQAGDRYSIRVTNPTARRVEAIISVDGLDVIDGEAADFASKRGYVVPPGGDLVVDGFRMSATQVASFRFSSVDESYAGRKGKSRNVGVIGVAIFEEKAEPQIIAPDPVPPPPTQGWDDRRWPTEEPASADSSAESGAAGGAPAPARRPAAPPADARLGGGEQQAKAPSSTAPTRQLDQNAGRGDCCREKKGRAGLGTQWGEERYSAVDFTRFERANQTVPTAMAELRYNDSEGLRALGILVQPAPDSNELYQRESADPFPAARGFATPPQ